MPAWEKARGSVATACRCLACGATEPRKALRATLISPASKPGLLPVLLRSTRCARGALGGLGSLREKHKVLPCGRSATYAQDDKLSGMVG